MQDRLSYYTPLYIFIAALGLFLIGLQQQEFINFDSRFGLFAQEMFRHGFTLFPTVYTIPYPDYPVTQTVLIYLSSLLFGKVSVFSGVLPTAIAAAISLMYTYKIVALQDKIWGFYAVFFLIATHAFFVEARSLSNDQFIVTSTVLCFYHCYKAHLQQQKINHWFITGLLLFAFAIRGPIGLIIPSAVIITFHFINKDFKSLWKQISISFSLLVFAMGLLLLAAYYTGGSDFVKQVWYMQVAGRMHGLGNYPWYFYGIRAFGSYSLAFPIAFLVLLAIRKELFTKQSAPIELLLYCLAWASIIMVGMSIPVEKKTRYILAIAPALAIIASYSLVDNRNLPLLHYLRKTFLIICASLPCIVLLLLSPIQHILFRHGIAIDLHMNVLFVIFSVLTAISIYVLLRVKPVTQRRFSLLAIAGVSYFIVQLLLVTPVIHALNESSVFVNHVMTLQKEDDDFVFYKMGPDGLDIKFMVMADRQVQPKFINTLQKLISYPHPGIIITESETLFPLPEELRNHVTILAEGNVGRKRCTAFRIQASSPAIKFPIQAVAS